MNGSLDSALKLLKDSSHDNEEEMEPNYNPIVYKNSTVTFTALDDAAYNGHIEIVRAISSNLLDINPHFKFTGLTPLHHATSNGHLNIVKYFENCIVDKNPKNDKGYGVMYYAVEWEQLDIINYYLEIFPDEDKNPKIDAISGRTPIHLSAGKGNLDIMQAFNVHLANINPRDDHGITPLHIAAEFGHLPITQYLVERVVEINPAADDYKFGNTPLHLAALNGYSNIVEYYLEKLPEEDRNPKLITSNVQFQGRTPLHNAAEGGYLEIVKIITKYLKNINPKNANGLTPLHLAAQNGHLSIVEFFVSKVDSINPALGPFYKSMTPFYVAADNGHLDIIQYYLEKLPMEDKNPKLNSSDVNFNGRTSLHAAAGKGHLDIVQAIHYYLPDGNINPCDAYGETPLHFAASGGHLQIVKYFVENLVNINPAGGDLSMTPFHWAAFNGYFDIVSYYLEKLPLTKKNPGLNSTDARLKGTTPLHFAASKGYLNIVQEISKYLTNINPEDADGCTSIHYATNENQLPIIKYFVDNVDDINPASCDFYEDDTLIGNGYTPLHVAAYKGYLDIVRFFVERLQSTEVQPTAVDGTTPLDAATQNNQLSVVKYLLEVLPKKNPGPSLLRAATLNGNLAMVEVITQNLIYAYFDGLDHGNVLHQRVPTDGIAFQVEETKCLNINPKDSHDYTTLHSAASNGYLDIVQFLVEQKLQNACWVNVDQSTDEFHNNQTPLHMAAANGHFSVVKYLIAKVSEPLAKDKFGKTAYDLALELGHTDVSTLLNGLCQQNNAESISKEGCGKTNGKCLCKEEYGKHGISWYHGDDCQFDCLPYDKSKILH